MTISSADDLGALLSDPEIRARATKRVDGFLETIQDYVDIALVDGDQETRQFVLRTLLPQLVKLKEDKDAESDVLEAKRETVELFRQMGAQLGPQKCPHCGEGL